jgi:hypothetical protein
VRLRAGRYTGIVDLQPSPQSILAFSDLPLGPLGVAGVKPAGFDRSEPYPIPHDCSVRVLIPRRRSLSALDCERISNDPARRSG